MKIRKIPILMVALIAVLGFSLVPRTVAPVMAEGAESATAVNLIRNPSFENDFTYWVTQGRQYSIDTNIVKRGKQSAKLIMTTAAVHLKQNVDLVSGKTYTFSSWYKVDAGKQAILKLDLNVNNAVYSSETFTIDGDTTTDWQEVTYSFAVPAHVSNPTFLINLGYSGTGKAAYADAFELYDTTGSGLPLTGEEVALTLSPQTKPLQLQYIGDNGTSTHDFGNESKYWSDSLFTIARNFGLSPYVPSPGKVAVTDQASLDTAIQAIKANPEHNDYIDPSSIQSDLAKGAADAPKYIDAIEACSENKRIGLTTLKVVPPYVQIDPTNIAKLWSSWQYSYAEGYLYAKNCGVTDFDIMNEPDAWIEDWSAYVNQLNLLSDAVRTGVKAAGLTATIWGPTFAANNQTHLDYIADHADQSIDVYDWHSYSTSTDFIGRLIDQYRNRVQQHNSDGILEPLSQSEFNYALGKRIEVNEFNTMPSVFKNMEIVKAQTDHGLFASIHFIFNRGNNSQGEPGGVYTLGLVSMDDVTSELTKPTKMYYGFRMFSREVSSPGDLVSYEMNGNLPSQQVEVTRHQGKYYVLFLNPTEVESNLSVDLKQLGLSQGVAVAREVSDRKNDEVVGSFPVADGIVSKPVPAQSMTLLIVSPDPQQLQPAVPVIHRAFATNSQIELWWSNSADTSTFSVKRRGEDGSSITVADQLPNAYFTDTTALPNTNYYYTVTGATYGQVSQPSAEVGPLRLEADPNLLPLNSSFESGTADNWTSDSGAWTVEKNDEDYGYATQSHSGQQSVATIGDTSWKDTVLESRVDLEQVGADGKFGLVTRYTDPNNYYLFELDKSANAAVIKKVANGQTELLASESLDGILDIGPSSTRYQIQAISEQGHLKLHISREVGKQVTVEVDDPHPLPQGKAGFIVENDAHASFDGLRVSAYFNDNFDGGPRSDWSGYANKWFVQNDASGNPWFIQTKRDAGKWEVAVNGSSEWQDDDVIAKIRPDDFSKKNATAAIFARYVDQDNYYRYELTADNELRAIKRVNGKEVTLASIDLPVQQGQVYDIRVRLDKNLQKVYVNGILKLQFTQYDPALSHGKIAVGTYEAAAGFDDVTVNPNQSLDLP